MTKRTFYYRTGNSGSLSESQSKASESSNGCMTAGSKSDGRHEEYRRLLYSLNGKIPAEEVTIEPISAFISGMIGG